MIFWSSFEQGASSLVIFARDHIQRELQGDSAMLYNIFNALLTLIPLLLISGVLFLLIKKTYKKKYSRPVIVLLVVL